MINSVQMLPREIRNQKTFFESLEKDVKKASVGSEIRILYEKFNAFCLNVGITHSLGNWAYENDTCNEDFRNELLSNIDMAKNVCLSKTESSSSSTSLTINNKNQQEQNQNISLDLSECLRKSLTGEQFDELMELIQKKADKKTIGEKIKDFGTDVISGVLAGIISSQMI
jgi:hypothetical protein